MNTKTIEKNWTELKGKIKSKWGKFNDEEVESIKGDLTLLAGKIQKVYGIAKDHADRQYDEFKKSVHALIGENAGAETPKASPAIASVTILPKPNPIVTPQVAKVAEPAAMKDSKVG